MDMTMLTDIAITGDPDQGHRKFIHYRRTCMVNRLPDRRIGSPKEAILKGHSPSTKIRNPRTNAMQHYISQSDAVAFPSKFYTLRSMSLLFDRSWQRLNADWTDAEIKPFSPDGVNYGKEPYLPFAALCTKVSFQIDLDAGGIWERDVTSYKFVDKRRVSAGTYTRKYISH